LDSEHSSPTSLRGARWSIDAGHRLAFWRGLVGSRIPLADRSGSFLVVGVQDLTTSRAAATSRPAAQRRPARPARGGEAFLIRLRAEEVARVGDHVIPDRTLRLAHPAAGRFDLFVTVANAALNEYVAVVNNRFPVS
jgi:hypothetical protein